MFNVQYKYIKYVQCSVQASYYRGDEADDGVEGGDLAEDRRQQILVSQLGEQTGICSNFSPVFLIVSDKFVLFRQLGEQTRFCYPNFGLHSQL